MSRTENFDDGAVGAARVMMVSVIGAGWWKRDARDVGEDRSALRPSPKVRSGATCCSRPRLFTRRPEHQPVTDQTLRGNPWIAAFVFTQCAGPCPMMSANMAKLHSGYDLIEARLVTVDPQRDTPAVLKQYAQRFKADESRWSF